MPVKLVLIKPMCAGSKNLNNYVFMLRLIYFTNKYWNPFRDCIFGNIL